MSILKKCFLSALIFLSFSSTTLAAATWWDTKDVRKNSDGTLEYSIELKNFMNKYNGDIFNGLAVKKYGKYIRFEYLSGKSIITYKDSFGTSIVALKGTINGKDITNVPLTTPIDVKYIAHNEKCKNAIITDNKKSELRKYDRVTKKKGIEVSANCGCPIILEKEVQAILTPENEAIWSMIKSLSFDTKLFVKDIKLSEVHQDYWRPNMFNGTYMFNGREYTLDLYQKLSAITTVNIHPVESVYDNSAIFEIYQSKSSSFRQYRVYKVGTTYKVQEYYGATPDKLVNPSKYDAIHYISPTEELVEYAEAISHLLGIDISH